MTYGVHAFKNKFFSNPQELNQTYKGQSHYLNEELRKQIDITCSQAEPNVNHLQEIDASEAWVKDALTLDNPATLSDIEHQIKHIQSIKEKIITEASKDCQIKIYFNKCEERAKALQKLHEKYQTGGNIDNIPKHLISSLPEMPHPSETIQIVLQDLEEADKVLKSRLDEVQHLTKGYDACEFKKYIARNQFDNAQLINVEELLKSESIYAKDAKKLSGMHSSRIH